MEQAEKGPPPLKGTSGPARSGSALGMDWQSKAE
jgi:hypothetical protein